MTYDIRNIRVKVHDRLVIHHQDDAQSVYSVSQLQQELTTPSWPSNSKATWIQYIPHCKKMHFFWQIQTEFQRGMYEKYAGCILCMDSTYGTNAYQYKLITCIVPDHYGQSNFYTVAMHSKCTQTMQDIQLLGAFPTEKLQTFLDACKNSPLMSKLKFS